jgi:hypothetical protein
MKEKLKISQLRISLMGLCTGAIMFGLTTGSVLAQDDKAGYEEYQKNKAGYEEYLKNKAGYEEYQKKQADKKLPPHQRPTPSKTPANVPAGNLAEAATNPIAPMVQLQLQDAYNWENHNSDGYSNETIVQAVAPIPLPWEEVPMLITRLTLPWVTTSKIAEPVGRHRGFGDFDLLLLATPKLETKGVQIGLGLNTSWPTAGDNDFTGSGKYQAGPAFLYINMQIPKFQWGMFAYQLWDYASSNGDSDRPGVSKLSLQPILTKHFSGGWYVASPDTPQTYDFKSNKWTWALGAQVGRVTTLGKLPVKWFGEVLYNPEDNNGPTAEWTAKVGLTFLFPE